MMTIYFYGWIGEIIKGKYVEKRYAEEWNEIREKKIGLPVFGSIVILPFLLDYQ